MPSSALGLLYCVFLIYKEGMERRFFALDGGYNIRKR